MNKKILITLITLIIIIGIICGIAFSKNTTKNTTTNTQKQEENTITNEETNNNANVNEITENAVNENNTIENNASENTQATILPDEPQETPKTDDEKAIEIVKKDYGARENIKFTVEGTDSNGRIVVVVSNTNTTAAIAFYHVDISTGTFTKE